MCPYRQGGVVARTHGARPAFGHNRCLPVAIHGCPRNIPTAGDPRQAIDAIDGGRDRLAHGLDLQRAKGAPASRRAIFSATARSPWSSRRPFPSAARSHCRGRRARALSAPPRRPAKPAPAIPDNRAAVTFAPVPAAPAARPAAAGSPPAASASPRSVAQVARRRTCLRQLLGGAPTSPPAPSCPPPSFRPFGSPSFPCGPFNRSRMSQPTLMHPTRRRHPHHRTMSDLV